ncbi:MAG: hypothetical protein K2N60_11185 [Oscillospiraceae bacterium]|nr:hypothetical protein [Oscillospiraceae bacterium]
MKIRTDSVNAAVKERRKKRRRIFAYILVSAASLYVVLFLLSLIIVNGYDSVKYRSGGWMVTEITTIDLKNGSGHISYHSDISEGRDFETDITVSENDLRELKIKMAFALVPFWSSEYVNPMIMDGDMWGFHFYRGDSEKSVYGSNAYPFGYGMITRLLYELENEAAQNLQG